MVSSTLAVRGLSLQTEPSVFTGCCRSSGNSQQPSFEDDRDVREYSVSFSPTPV